MKYQSISLGPLANAEMKMNTKIGVANFIIHTIENISEEYDTTFILLEYCIDGTLTVQHV